MPLSKIVERRLMPLVMDRLREEQVIILNGPRTVGKSTLLRGIAARIGKGVLDLDDPATRDAVRADPALFVNGPSPVLIDEFQHVPEILDTIKAALNVDGRPGRFVITGSTRFSTLPMAAQALTGRAHLVEVRPLSQGEIHGCAEDFASALLIDPAEIAQRPAAVTARMDYAERVVAGGFPLALRRGTPAHRGRWFDDYIDLVIDRDIIDLSRVRQRQQLPRLLRLLAAQTAQVLNMSRAADVLGMEKSTTENYTRLLEAVFMVSRLPAWGTTLGSRVTAAPKVHVTDAGLAAHLLRLTAPKLAAASAVSLTEFGHLLETFVVGEVSKQLDWLDAPTTRGHWRTHDGEEVDLVVERADGGVVGLEVKAGGRVAPRDLRALRSLRRRLGALFLGGVALYTGERSYTADDRLHIVPIDRLWRRAGA